MTALSGSPRRLGFIRSEKHDGLIKCHAGWEAWQTPEGVLLALPPRCTMVQLLLVSGARGETLACVFPEGVHSIWPFKKGATNHEA